MSSLDQDVNNRPSASERRSAKGLQGKASTYSIHHPHAVTRPLPFFHPTRAVFTPHANSDEDIHGIPHRAPSAHWSSRASRKNRYARRPIQVGAQPAARERETQDISLPHKELVLLEQRVRHSETRFKVHLTWDISFWVAVVFVLGSTIWVVNGFVLFLPLVNAGTDDFPAAAWSAFVGGTLFEIGSYLMYVEALNTGHEQLFGPALRELLGHANGTVSESASPDSDSANAEKGLRSDGGPVGGRQRFKFRWIGAGSWRELGFLACFVQMWAATIFWVSTITGLPNVISGFPDDPPTAITDVFYWTPQVVGGCGFIISSLLLMIEVQKKWWLPNLSSLGWHIGFWNLVGAVGFTLCGALGYASLASSGVNYQSVLSTFWGSWAFLIGSVIQLWETLWREDTPKQEN
ncbi:hypothetical protein PYCCODRAFT_1396225 [Trametes coccinea BRFM310]|uniref:Integral membrane protein n=1 Tax=Trametes coccinea (strain BRFM310) TaxID=1353009 RepID=A0A1Y2ICJ8_TRAC3|nr:hypothetical protein PYCCODRAFT_1396225 [Trametes coccinea BRFM310]